MLKEHQVGFNHCEFIELACGATAKATFGQQDRLKNSVVKAIDCWLVNNVSLAPTGATVVNAAVFKKAFLVLKINGEEKVNKIPLIKFEPTQNNGRTFTFERPVEIDWNNSYVEVASTAGVVAAEVYLFNVYFDRKGDKC